MGLFFAQKSLINTRKAHQKRRLKTGTFSASHISNTKNEFGNTNLEVRYERCKTCGSTKANFKSLFSRIAQRTCRRIYQAKQSAA